MNRRNLILFNRAFERVMKMKYNEEYLKQYFDNEYHLQKKRPMSKEKMETKDFADKYWMGGSEPYQYHSLQIEDGETELQQLMINDIRALKDREVVLREFFVMKGHEKQKQIDELKKYTRLLSATVCVVIGFVTVGHIQRCRRNSRSRGFFRKL